MSKLDKTKEQIGWLKVVFGLLFATDLSIIAYIFNTYNQLSNIKLILAILALMLVTAALIYINKKLWKKLTVWRIYNNGIRSFNI